MSSVLVTSFSASIFGRVASRYTAQLYRSRCSESSGRLTDAGEVEAIPHEVINLTQDDSDKEMKEADRS